MFPSTHLRLEVYRQYLWRPGVVGSICCDCCGNSASVPHHQAAQQQTPVIARVASTAFASGNASNNRRANLQSVHVYSITPPQMTMK
jgi:hypothetical protein